MTEIGQTDNYTVSDHLNAIIEHCGNGIVDYCIYDTGEIIPEFIKKYNLEGQDLVEQDIEKTKGIKYLQRDLSMVVNGHIRHDPNLVASSIIELICDDLKYQDKQNDPQYLMLNTKLREEKRINKIKKSMKKKQNKNVKTKKHTDIPKSKSKFSNKYSDRIASIREADQKARIKTQKEQNKKEQVRKEQIRKEMMKKMQEKKENKQVPAKSTETKQTTKQTTKQATKQNTKQTTKPKSARGLNRKKKE